MKLTYHRCGDYLLPALTIPDESVTLGKYGRTVSYTHLVIKKKDQAEDIIHNISKYANSQNKINMSDFNANDAYHVKMERLSRATPIPVARCV